MNTCLRCGLALALMLPAFGCAGGAELQEKNDAAAPGDVVTVGPAVYRERIIIRKPLTLVGEGFPAIAGDGTDKTVRIEADRVTLRGFRISGSGLNLSNETRLENNQITHNAVGLSFNQCNRNQVIGNEITHNYIGLRFGSNSDDNRFSANVFVKNLHPVEVAGETGTNRWSVSGVGNFWEGAQGLDLDADGVNDLPHRELDLFGVLRRDFPAIALLSESPAVKLLRFAHERAKLPGFQSIEDDAPLMRPPERLASTLPSLALERSDVRKHDPPE